MKKLLKILLLFTILLALLLSASLFFLFSDKGNKFLKPYIQAEIEKKIKLPVDVSFFKLRFDNTEIKLTINSALNIEAKSDFSVFTQKFNGNYQILANNFLYKKIELIQANIHGIFRGTPDDIEINGKGTSFNAPLDYIINVVEGEVKGLTATLNGMDISKVLTLMAKPKFLQGKIEGMIKINDINTLNGEFSLRGKDLISEPIAMKKLIGKSVSMNMDVMIKGDINNANASILALLKSSFGELTLNKMLLDIKKKHFDTDYSLDILDLEKLQTLTQKKLYGKLLLEGNLSKRKSLKIIGKTTSLGGEIEYKFLSDIFNANMHDVRVINMLKILGYPQVINGKVSGKITHNIKEKRGTVAFKIKEFQLFPNKMTKMLAYIIQKDPTHIMFDETSLNATIKGDDIRYTLVAKGNGAGITIENGYINPLADKHRATIKFMYHSYAIAITLSGSVSNPKITLDTEGLISTQMTKEVQNKVKKEVEGKVKRFFKKLGF